MRTNRPFLIFLLIMNLTSCAQDARVSELKRFVNDAKARQIPDIELIERYIKSEQENPEATRQVVQQRISFIRQQLVNHCNNLEIVKHDTTSTVIKNFKLKPGKYNTEDIYYIICDDIIVCPVLFEGDKMKTVTTYSKTETGSKNFVVF